MRISLNNFIAIRYILIFLLGTASTISYAQRYNFEWAFNMGSDARDHSVGKDIAVDAKGNIYITGYFTDTVDFDPGLREAILISVTPRRSDIFIAKYDPQGNYLWARSMGGNTPEQSIEEGRAIAVDAKGNVYITGIIGSQIHIEHGKGVDTLTPLGPMDVLIAKYDTDGNYLWAKRMGGEGIDMFPDFPGMFMWDNDQSYGIAVDADGNAYVTGQFISDILFEHTGGVDTLNGDLNGDIFLVKYDTDGNYIWAKGLGQGRCVLKLFSFA